MIITMRHMRQCGYCSRGVRTFFDRHGFDWSDFLKNGIDEKYLLNTNDQMAIKVVELANNGQR